MKAEKFEFGFTYLGKKYQALAYRYGEQEHPSIPYYWVHLPDANHGKVYTFYFNQERKTKHPLVWSPLKPGEEPLARAMARVLVKGQKELGL